MNLINNKPKITRFNWLRILMKDKFWGKVHSHERENSRRKRQIEKGMLKVNT